MGPVTAATTAFHDPYLLLGPHAFESYVSSWMDSGINQLSMLTRFVDLTDLTARHEDDRGAGAWCTAAYTTGGARHGPAAHQLAHHGQQQGDRADAGRRRRRGLDRPHGDDRLHGPGAGLAGRLRQRARAAPQDRHYRPLYETLLSAADDPVLGFGTAATVTRLLHARPG